MINKRQNTRIPLSGLANIKLKKQGKSQSIQSVIANISSQGMGVYAYNPIELKNDVLITVNFVFLDGSLKTDSLNGRIVSNKKIDNTFFIGIQFEEETDAKNQPFLFEHINTKKTLISH